MIKDYYSILGITNKATISEIKIAYRKLALKYHPDQNKSENATRRFIEFTEAYEVLKDIVKRTEYDRLYNEIINNSYRTESQSEIFNADAKYEEWSEYGRTKAEEYSSISINDFGRQILKEISIGVSFIPKTLLILFYVSMIITMITMLPQLSQNAPETIGGIIIMLIGFSYFAYSLFNEVKKDYLEDRKRAF